MEIFIRLTISNFLYIIILIILAGITIATLGGENGLLGNRNKKTKLAICKKLTNTANFEPQEKNTLEILKKTLGIDFNLCPFCKTGHMINPNSA